MGVSDYITIAAIGVACVLIIVDIALTIWTHRKERKDGDKKV